VRDKEGTKVDKTLGLLHPATHDWGLIALAILEK
jgi:hypothetical protein